MGDAVIANIAHANAFAVADPYRAVTHNKGIFNGIDSVAMATGNDWRGAGGRWPRLGGAERSIPCPHRVARGVTAMPAVGGEGVQTAQRSAWQNVPMPALYGRLELPLARGRCGRGDACAAHGTGGAQDSGRAHCARTGRDHRCRRAGAESGGAAVGKPKASSAAI